jgi:hypothetical protein
MQFAAVHHVTIKGFIQRCHQPATRIHPVGEQSPAQIHALAGKDFALAIERQVFAVFGR